MRKPALAAVLIGAALSPASAAAPDQPCTVAESRGYTVDFDPADHPYRSLAVNPGFGDACKRYLLGITQDFTGYAAAAGLCPGERCRVYARSASLIAGVAYSSGKPLCPETHSSRPAVPATQPCALDASYASAIDQADGLLGAQLEREVAVIERKIADGLVPHCLVPQDCPGAGCRASLVRLWWNDSASKRASGETWIPVGSFSHLLVGQGFTCPTNRQRGGTCAIFSGVSLMSHYCATPKYNPSAADSCSSSGPGFRCVDQNELLAAVFAAGKWGATLGACDKEKGYCAIAPALGNSDAGQEQKLQEELDAAGCAPGVASPPCDALNRKLFDFRMKPARRLGGDPKRYVDGKVWVSGDAGTSVADMAEVYRRYGFQSVHYSKERWDDVLSALSAGHPVQVDLDVRKRDGYAKDKDEAAHAVVLEAAYADESGERVLVRDSNDPDVVKSWPAAEAKSTFFERAGGGVSVCPPTDPDRAARCGAAP